MIFIVGPNGLYNLNGSDLVGRAADDTSFDVVLTSRRRTVTLYTGDFATARNVLQRILGIIQDNRSLRHVVIEREDYMPASAAEPKEKTA